MTHKTNHGGTETRSFFEIPSGARDHYRTHTVAPLLPDFDGLTQILESSTSLVSAETPAPQARKSLAHPQPSAREGVRVGKRLENKEPRRGGTSQFIVLGIACLLLISGTGMRGQQAAAVQFADILSNPAQFHGKTIEVRGFLLQEYENSGLYAGENWRGTKGIWITPGADLHISRGAINRHYVIVSGVFDANDHGHLGQFAGNLKISKLVVEKDRTSGSSSGK